MFRLLLFLLTFSTSAFAALPCEELLKNPVVQSHVSSSLLRELKTELNESNRKDLVTLELTQDATHILESVPSFIPDRALVFMAKRAFNKKMRKLLGLSKKDPERPQISQMSLQKNEIQYDGRDSTSQIIVRLTLKREHLAPVLEDYVQSLNHPALGNFIISLDTN